MDGQSNSTSSFFYLVGDDLLKAVEFSRRKGRVTPTLNSTFLTLIPKCERPQTFAYYHPISLCNLLYKLISKIATNRLKPFLDRSISPEQFGFLKDKKILEPVGITQEALHTIKSRKRKALVLKLDLVKAFDRFNWTFLRLILL